VDEVIRANPQINPQDIVASLWGVQNACRRKDVSAFVTKEGLRLLPETQSVSARILGLTLIGIASREPHRNEIAECLNAEEPWIRRSALVVAARIDPELVLDRFANLVEDPSSYVRQAAAAVCIPGASLDMRLMPETEYGHSLQSTVYRHARRRKDALVGHLKTLFSDPYPPVRILAACALDAFGREIDGRSWIAACMALDATEAEQVVADIGYTYGKRLIRRHLDVALALDEKSDGRYGWLYELDRHDDEPKLESRDAFVTVPTLRQIAAKFQLPATKEAPSADEPNMRAGVQMGEFPPGRPPPASPVTVIYFFERGCRECALLKPYLDGLPQRYPQIDVRSFDIEQKESKKLNEALCERFGVPWRQRLVAPALFTAAGALVKGEVRPASVDNLLRLAAGRGAQAAGWAEVPEPEIAQAEKAIEKRFAKLTISVVLGAGLADGVNPCAFAVIVLLVSYLQLKRRRPAETLIAGVAFAGAVFVTYFLIGLGLVEALARIQENGWAARALRIATGTVAAVFALLSVRDAVRCMQGHIEDMTLQLSDGVKERIRKSLRWGLTGPRVAVTAACTGAIVSVLELACTGQVYAPTIVFALRNGSTRPRAALWLLTYNAAFILPLLVVTALAFTGVRSNRLSRILHDHAAVVKFATALLFGVMAAALLF
jgi:cytochrome c biogenesis protein CcdA